MIRGVDDDVVAAARHGDPDAWRELYAAHAGRLLVWLRARPLLDAAVSPDDVASEAWLTAARRIPEFTGTSEEFAGWLFGIARKTSANQARRGSRRAHAPLDDQEAVARRAAPAAGPEERVPGEAWVRDLLATLPAREREVLACTEVVGLDTETTARVLGVSAVTVRVTRHRGLKRLRGLLDRPDPAAVRPDPGSRVLVLRDVLDAS